MASLKDPVLFSKYFGIDADKINNAGLIDPFVNVDTQLFIDPVLLEKCAFSEIRENALSTFRAHFTNFIRLLAISQAEGDAAWRGARRLLDLQEPPENGLGYGGSGRSGNSRPDDVRFTMMRTAKEIVELGSKDPEMVSLMGFFEDNVGPDTISDFTTRVIMASLASVTMTFCDQNGIPTQETGVSKDSRLPVFLDSIGRPRPIVLVPGDIVRELPVAKDWSDIEKAAFENAQIRQRVNMLLARIAKPTIADRKDALRRVALSSSDEFERFLATVKEHTVFYDKNIDALAYYKIKSILSEDLRQFESLNKYDFTVGPEEIRSVVMDTIEIFKHHVENGNLWEELWVGDKPKKERAAQLIYFAIADCFCKANNIDISPEANMGGGPIDFKFSKGYKARVLVEMKRSSGTVRHGYERQLEIYKDASQTQYGIFVVMDFGDLGEKYLQIDEIRRERIKQGEIASDIVIIDARRKISASKRN